MSSANGAFGVRAAQFFRSSYHFLRLGRPLFLTGGFLFHGLGVARALYTGAELNFAALVWGQIAITAIQWMTHYANDYFDLAADLANPTPTDWSGGSRVLVENRLPPRVALLAAVTLASLAAIASFWLALVVGTGPLTVPLLLLAIFLAWQYSGPPLRLHSSGFGELSVALLVPGLTPLVGFYLQAGRLALLPFLALLPLCCFQFTMLLAINFPDATGDAAVGKKTLVVRWGGLNVARLYGLVLLIAYGLLPFLFLAGLPLEVTVALVALSPLALGQGRRMLRGAWRDPGRWNSLAFWTIGLFMASSAAELFAFLWLLLRDGNGILG